MPLRLFNTLTKKKELFKPLKDKKVGLYTCGPTVYDFAHIGNFRTYVLQDVLKRWLIHKGFKVTHTMNLTDVDDKTIKGSRQQGISLSKFTEKFTEEFFSDMLTLNILPADVFPRATEHITEMVLLVKNLLKKKIAYKTNDGVYFDISKFRNYGKLSKLKVRELRTNATMRNDLYTKEEAQDFALWKFWDKEDGDVFWETDIGKGRPGWHLECSAMSMKYLGKTFDIHTGGIDLVFPHHENEIAQSEAATGKKFVKYWFHCEHLLVDGQKMSKSLGNFYTLRDILNRGYDARAIRYLLLSSSFRQQLNFTFQSLDAAKRTVENLSDFIRRLNGINGSKNNSKVRKMLLNAQKEFVDSMDNNLNTADALASIFKFTTAINNLIESNSIGKSDSKVIIAAFLDFDKVLGLGLKNSIEKRELPKEALNLIKGREAARKLGDFAKADEIRNKLKEDYGIIIEDTKDGVRWKFAD